MNGTNELKSIIEYYKAKGYTLISYHLYDPINYIKLFSNIHNKNDKQKCNLYFCNNCKNCELYKDKLCIDHNEKCPHRDIYILTGYTSKAKKYRLWFDNVTGILGKDKKDCLKMDYKKLCRIDDYVFLPMKHLKTYREEIEGIVNNKFIPTTKFNNDKIKELLEYRPHSLFENVEIKNYREESIPKFIQQLKENMPERYNDFLREYSNYKLLFKCYSNNHIGKTAYLNTINNGSKFKDCHGNIWQVQDNKIYCKEMYTSINTPFKLIGAFESVEVSITIHDNAVIKIEDNSWVNKGTKFYD